MIVSAALLIASLALPLTISAHVNRTVGPYTFFLVLIEEPTFESNRAGFEFRVHDGDRSIEGLDRTLHAVATGAAGPVALVVSGVNAQGWYDVETDTTGRPFDPGAGGDWTLRLTGTVEPQYTGNGTENYTPHLESSMQLYYSTTATNDPGSFVSIMPTGSTVPCRWRWRRRLPLPSR